MPNRVLRDDILRSERLDKISGDAESLYYRLMVAADDLGRFEAHGAAIGTKCYPRRVPPVTRMASFAEFMGKMEELLKELVEAELVFLYNIGNERFGTFYKWRQRLRIVKKKFPDPPHDVLAKCAVDDGRDDKQYDGHTDGHADGHNVVLYPNPNPNQKPKPKPDPELFDRFWQEYPKKIGKPLAEKAFYAVLGKSEDPSVVFQAMLVGIQNHKKCDQWCRDRGMFIPYPASWLHQRRWEDEVTPSAVTATPQSMPIRKSVRESWQIEKDIESVRHQQEKVLDPMRYSYTCGWENMKAMATKGDTKAVEDLAAWTRLRERKQALEVELRLL
jgi:hypothetical protein